jgi:hypothetical protein
LGSANSKAQEGGVIIAAILLFMILVTVGMCLVPDL